MSTYGFISANEIIAAYNQEGIWKLGYVDITKKTLTPLELEFDVKESSHKKVTSIEYVRVYSNECATTVVFSAGGPYQTPSIVSFQYTLGVTKYDLTVLRKGMDRDIFNTAQEGIIQKPLSGYISKSTSIEYPTTGIDGISHAFFYPPTNPDYEPPQEEKPPLLIIAHGGPTASTTTALNMTIQYFTSRGFAVADVNYRGSSGYGRKYRLSLYQNFGILDRDDCVKCAEYLAKSERKISIDENRVVARGGSAGGYLTLVLATYTKLLKAGASYYGISDLRTFAEKTHKFESTYAFVLVTDEDNLVKEFEMRSPINNIALLDCPMIFFQGLDDKVVPPDQTEKMVNALKERGKPVEEETFPGEGHGFKKAENIKKALEAELNFYSQILEFELADDSI
jgi:dipeptidyl aminopeptidase/acylaminoacyl peptidase